MERFARLSEVIPSREQRKAFSVPGIWDGLSMQLVEQAGFQAAFLSGGALSMARHGRPDIGLVTASELSTTVSIVREISDLPLIVDADTGFGNALNAQRTMRMLERAGATALQLEDQSFPKRCGHMAGKSVIPAKEYIGKLKSMLDARLSPSTLLVARTDARGVEGFEAALERSHLYLEAGADLLFIEGPQSIEEMEIIGQRFGATNPLVHNMVEGSGSPVHSRAQLEELGYTIALHPLLLLHGFIRSAPDWLKTLSLTGSTKGLGDRIADLGAFNQLLGTSGILEAAKEYQ